MIYANVSNLKTFDFGYFQASVMKRKYFVNLRPVFHHAEVFAPSGIILFKALLTQRFSTFRCVPCVKIKDTDDVLPIKEGPQLP